MTVRQRSLWMAAADDSKNRVILGDALQVLPELIQAGESYDVIIADPPYNIGKDFGNNSSEMPIDDYVRWAKNWLTDCLELLKDNGLLYLYRAQPGFCGFCQ